MPATPIAFEKNPNVIVHQQSPKKDESKKPDKKQWTKEELDELSKVTLEGLGWNPPPEKKDAAPAPAPAPEKPEDQSTLETPKAATKPKPPAKPKPDMADRIAAKISQENEKLIDRLQPAAKPSVEPAPAKPVDPKDEERRRVFAVMASIDPDNRELPKRFEEFLERERKYIEDWQKDNPGKKYDNGSEEHTSWYDDNQLEYDPVEYAEAKLEMRLAAREAENQSRTAQQTALASAENAIESVTEALETDVQASLNDIVGENTILQEPGAITDKFQSVVDHLSNKIKAAALLMTAGTGVELQHNNPLHAEIYRSVHDFDAVIAALPPDEQKNLISSALGKKNKLAGKTFAPMDRFQHLSREEQGKCWTIATEPTLAAKLMAVQAKEEINGWLNGIFKQISKKTPPATATVPSPASTAPTSSAPTSAASKPNPPSLSPGVADVTPQAGERVRSQNSWEDIARNF